MKAGRCQPLRVRVRVRERLTEVCVQCPHPQPLSPRLGTSSFPSPPGSSLLPQPGGPGRALGETGTGSSGTGGLWGWGLLERSVESLGRKVGKAEMRGLWRGPGDLGFPSRGSARELGGGGRSLALPLGGDLSLSAPSPRRRRLPLVWPRRPRPRPRPAPARSLPSRRRGRGRGPGRRARPGRCPFPRVNSLPCPPALPRAAGAERPLPPLPGR